MRHPLSHPGALLPLGLLLVILLLGTALGCDGGIRSLEYSVLRTLPHDQEAYTQGLVFHGGFLYESTGQYGTSTVRKVDPESGEVLLWASLPEDHFGEGLARVGAELIQLTWHAGVAYVYGLDSLTLRRTLTYEGEGWGLCFDGESLWMSDGSTRLLRRDPESFQVLGELRVTEGGFSVARLNELECVGDRIYANVFMTNRIVGIEKTSGRVVAELDGYALSTASRRAPNPEAVLNGIAHDPERDVFFLTGKLWPDLFEVRIPER
jgi:glutamine cyclotransferase